MALTVLGEVARIRPHLARINVPTLVLCGPKDRANLPAARTLAAGMPPAQWCVIGGSGHELNSQKPDEMNTEITAFLQQVPCPAGNLRAVLYLCCHAPIPNQPRS